ncbi:MAG: glycosyltransferase [Bacilli bacterium]|nr:glycosyltransferase [Bacilli bacterium]
MRIGIFTDTFYPEINGVAVSCLSLYETLTKNGHEVYVFCSGKKTEYDPEKRIYRIHGLYLKRIYGYRLVLPGHPKIYRFIKSLNLDIIHVNTEEMCSIIGMRAAKLFKIPSVYTYHTKLEDYTYYITKGNEKFDKVSKNILRRVLRKYCKSVDEIVVPSQDTKDYIQTHGVKKYVNVIPTGFDFLRFKSVEKDSEKCLELKKTLQISDKNFVLLVLGRIASEKSIDKVVNLFTSYVKEKNNTDMRLLIVGDGPYLNAIKKVVEINKIEKQVIFTGKVPSNETQYYYAISDVFLNASTTETQGLTYMEAMCSKLILLVKRAKNLEGVIRDGKNGFIFDSQEDFLEKLDKIYNLSGKEKERIILNSIYSMNKYSAEAFYNNIMVVYERAKKDRY